MNELQRQRYLKQMGFTPWVAATPLPGAAPSPLLEWPARSQPSATAAQNPPATQEVQPVVAKPAESAESIGEAPPIDIAALLNSPATASVSESVSTDGKPALKAEKAPGRTEEGLNTGLMFTLQAHVAGDLHVWVEQQQADAPSLSRDELFLLNRLLGVLGGTPQADPRRLVCVPGAGQSMTPELARPMFQAFARGVLGKDSQTRLLLCAREATIQALFDGPHYQLWQQGNLTCLPVSALAEMLGDPLQHKRNSWNAMLRHGFYQRHG
ncbi:MAG: hypothetical protein CVV10_01115 [Gammaproteobacteria bacterium HGW-Gammaproteobacteria-14]|nr:MAG: hypothetical protein CVV10_01115 [Gammaproteobacteria bacterium HGW-Gammaproteobacteria-14]